MEPISLLACRRFASIIIILLLGFLGSFAMLSPHIEAADDSFDVETPQEYSAENVEKIRNEIKKAPPVTGMNIRSWLCLLVMIILVVAFVVIFVFVLFRSQKISIKTRSILCCIEGLILGVLIGFFAAQYFALWGGLDSLGQPYSPARMALVPGHVAFFAVVFGAAGFFVGRAGRKRDA